MTYNHNHGSNMIQTRSKNFLILMIAGMGMLLSTLDTGIINVALPYLENQFHASTSTTALSVVGYTLSLAVFILPFGYLGDRFGKLKISLLGLFVFGLGSFFCGLAANILSLIIFRIIQGIGAAALQATSAALITTLIDRRNVSRALGILGIMIGVGPILGPSVGGFFLALNAWQLIFWINIPFALLGIVFNQLLIHHIHEQTHHSPFDLWGSLINALMIISLLTGFTLLSKPNHSSLGFILIGSGIIIGIIFYCTESKVSYPLINFKLLVKSTTIWLYLWQTIVFGFASAIIFLLPPYIFENLQHINVGLTGLFVLGAPLGLVIFSRISGNQNDGSKNGKFSTLGLIIMTSSLIALIFFSENSQAIITSGLLFLFGVGGGYFQPANIGAIMQSGSLDAQGTLGSLQRMVQNIAIASGTAIGSTVINLTSPNLALGIRTSWLIVSTLVILTVTFGLLVTSKSHHSII